MNRPKTTQGSNYSFVSAGSKEEWEKYGQQRPEVPIPIRSKLFLKELLGATGMEFSLNVLPPGGGLPFLHRHQDNDEIYFVVGGRGQFMVDGHCFDVEEGGTVRITPAGARAIRNNSDAPLYFLCLQYKADSVIEGTTRDGRKVEASLVWPPKSHSV